MANISATLILDSSIPRVTTYQSGVVFLISLGTVCAYCIGVARNLSWSEVGTPVLRPEGPKFEDEGWGWGFG